MMKWTECRATRREIDQAEVGEQLSAQAQRHVGSCAACGAFQNERARLRELLTSLEPVTAPADFDFRLRARIAAQRESVGPRSFFASFVLSTPAIAVATVVVLLGLSVLWMTQHGTNPSSTVAANPPDHVREGISPTTDDSKVAIKESKPPLNINGGGNEPVYLVRGNKGLSNQLKGAASKSGQPGRSTRDFSALGAQSIRQGQNAIDVSVSAPLKPMVLSFQDDNGATRTFSLPPVSFGSQRLLESRVVPVSSKNARVW
jgi:hypothetical protein